MRFLWIFIAGVVLVIGVVLYIQTRTSRAHDRVHALCNTTRTGEPWAQVQARAKRDGFSFVRTSGPNMPLEEQQTVAEALGRRFGCTVVIGDGRVVTTRFGELPDW